MTDNKSYWKFRLNKWTELDKQDRISEALYGLIMVLTFTCSVSVSTVGEKEVRDLLWAALSCNIAWGLVDAIMYIMDEIISRARSITEFIKIRESDSDGASVEIFRRNISPLISELMSDEDVVRISLKIKLLPEPAMKTSLVVKDLFIALQIFFIVFLSTFPVALPFLFIEDVSVAMRVSNVAALILMFSAGFALARYSGLKPLVTASAYAAIGVFLVIITIILGG